MTPLTHLRRGDASPGVVLAIVCAGVVLAGLDLFIVNVALPDMARELDAPLSSLSWVLNAYAIVYAALLTPTSLSLILATAPDERRQSSIRAWTALGGLAAALGPVVGGLLVAADWRWIFIVNAPVGLAALYVGWRRLPAVPGHPVPRPDALGAALLIAGVAGLTLALVEGGEWGWSSPATLGTLAGSLAMCALFVAHCVHHRNPLVQPALFRSGSFAGASLVMTLFSASFGGLLLSIALWLQDVWGWSALQAGLAIAPGPIMVPVFSFLVAGRLIARFGPAPVVAAGATIFAAGLAWWALSAQLQPDYVGSILGGMLISGIGVGLTLPTLMATAAGSLPPQAFATGSAVINVFRQIGLALGVALFIAVLGTPDLGEETRAAFQAAWSVLAAVAIAAALGGAGLLRGRPQSRQPAAPPAAVDTPAA